MIFLHNSYGTPEFPNCGNLEGTDWMEGLRWANKEPSMIFRETNTNRSVHFRKANTNLSEIQIAGKFQKLLVSCTFPILKIHIYAYISIFSLTTSKIDSESRFEMRMSIFQYKIFFSKSFGQYFKKSKNGFPIVF